jgi:hypothetical protein
MATAIRDITGSISLKDKFSNVLNKFKTGTDNVVNSLKNFNGALEAAGAAYIASKVVDATFDLYKMGAEAENTGIRFRQLAGKDLALYEEAIENTMDASRGLAEDDSLKQAIINMNNYGASAIAAAGSLKQLQQLSVINKTSVEDMAGIFGRYIQYGRLPKTFGIAELSKYIKELKNETTQYGRERALLNMLNREGYTIESRYLELAGDAENQMIAVRTQWKELRQAFGETMLPILKPAIDLLIQGLQSIKKFIQELSPEKKKLIGYTLVFIGLSMAIVTLVAGVAALVAIFVAFGSVGPAIAAIAAGIIAIYAAMVELYDWFTGSKDDTVFDWWLGKFENLSENIQHVDWWLNTLIKTLRVYLALISFGGTEALRVGLEKAGLPVNDNSKTIDYAATNPSDLTTPSLSSVNKAVNNTTAKYGDTYVTNDINITTNVPNLGNIIKEYIEDSLNQVFGNARRQIY